MISELFLATWQVQRSAINDDGEIVGVSIDSSGNPRPVYWHNGAPVDLNTQVPSDSTMYLIWAEAINNHGEIAGWGVDKATGDIHTYLAIPYRCIGWLGPACELQRRRKHTGSTSRTCP